MRTSYVAALARAVHVLPPPDALPGGCAYEPKYDGWRAAVVTPPTGAPQLISRHGRRLDGYFPEVTAAARRLPAGTVVDGELLAWRDGRLDFAALGRRVTARRPPPGVAYGFAAFDLLELAGVDLRPCPYDARRRCLLDLLDLLGPATGVVAPVPMTTDPAAAAEWFDALVPLGVEGLVVKGRAETYRAGSRCWLKLRHRQTRDLVVGAVAGPARAPVLVLGARSRDRRLRVVGCTTALDAAVAGTVLPRLSPAGADHPWPAELPATLLGRLPGASRDAIPIRRVAPRLVVEVGADTAYEHGRYRHPLPLCRIRDEP